jgi:formamidopyrimidine-DNA glycosylase
MSPYNIDATSDTIELTPEQIKDILSDDNSWYGLGNIYNAAHLVRVVV